MHESWGMLIVLYLFLAGVSAGAFSTSASVLLTRGSRAEAYRPTIAWGAILAPFPVAIGTGLLVLDLGRPLAFYWLFSTLRFTSPMSFGVWFLSLFLLLSFIYLFVWLPEGWRGAVARYLPRGWRPLAGGPDEGLARVRWILAAVGLPIALGVAIYTAILLGASTRPLWNSPLLPQLFLFSAMSTGLAAVMVTVLVARWRSAAGRLSSRAGRSAMAAGVTAAGVTPAGAAAHYETAAAAETVSGGVHRGDPEMGLLLRADLALLGLELLTLLTMVLYSRLGSLSIRLAWDVMLGGAYAWTFWLGPVLIGILTPIALEVLELRHMAHGHAATARAGASTLGLLTGTFILIGGFLLRYVIVYAGQVGGFTH